MLNNRFQAHVGSDGTRGGRRISDEGYRWSIWAENVFAYADSVWHGHAAFTVDWGKGPGGMQNPPNHRRNLLNPDFTDVGIGHVIASTSAIGPHLVSQEFAVGPDSIRCVTGVVYYDLNSNGRYDAGEGIGGAEIEVPGSGYCAVTADAGGYAVPIPNDGVYDVWMSLPGRREKMADLAMHGEDSAKVDFRLAYPSMELKGAGVALVGTENAYRFNAIPGAKSYDLKLSRLRENEVKSGRVHLTFPSWEDQTFEPEADLRLSAGSDLRFSMKYKWATGESRLYAQVSTDGGGSWSSVWSRAGTNTAGDSRFVVVKVPLEEFAGATVRVRLLFRHHNKAYIGTEANLGVFIENLHVTGSHELLGSRVEVLSGGSSGFQFNPGSEDSYLLEVRPRLPEAVPFRDVMLVSALSVGSLSKGSTTSPRSTARESVISPVHALSEPEVRHTRLLSGHRIWMDFQTRGAEFPDEPVVEKSSTLREWSEERNAEILNLGNGHYRAEITSASGGDRVYYRIKSR